MTTENTPAWELAHVYFTDAQKQILKDLYIKMLNIPAIDTNLYNLTSVLMDIDYNIDFVFNSDYNYEQVYNIFKDILYTKTYCINDTSIICFQIDGGTFIATPQKLTSVLLELGVDFEVATYSLFYASSIIKYTGEYGLDRETYLSQVLQYVFNIGNVQETFLKL